MTLLKRQRGMTLIGFFMVLAVGCFFAFIGLKLFPPYQEYFSIKQAMASVQSQPGVSKKAPNEIRRMLESRFFASYVEIIKAKDVKIIRKNGYRITATYEDRMVFLGNLDLVLRFDNTVDLTGR
jgi:hypothetical protein